MDDYLLRYLAAITGVYQLPGEYIPATNPLDVMTGAH